MSMDSKQPPSSPQVSALGQYLETALDRAARAAEPPDYAQLAAYVDGTLDDVDREIVESWLESDPELRAEVEDLRALHDVMGVPAATPMSDVGAGAGSASRTGSAAASRTWEAGEAGDASSPGAPAAAPVSAPTDIPRRTATTSASVSTSTSGGVLPFERKGTTRPGGVTPRRFGTVTVIMGAMAAAVIGAVTWMVVRSARLDEVRPGAGSGAAGSQVARQGSQAQGPEQQAPQSHGGRQTQGQQPPPVQSQSRPQAQSPGTGSATTGSGGTGATGAGAAGTGGSAAPEAVVVRDAGGAIAVDAAGKVTGLTVEGEAATPAMTQLVADALMKGAMPSSSAAAGLGGRELTLMSRSRVRQASATTLAPLSPIATLVRSSQPVFRWSPHPGARSYVVTIYGRDFDQVMASPVLTETTWTPAEALKPGVTYQWQVTADTPEGPVRAPAPPAPDARFRIIGAAAGKTLDRDLARAGSSQLLKGLLLAQAGVLDEAEQAFEALQTANPNSKRVAALLARVRERRSAP